MKNYLNYCVRKMGGYWMLGLGILVTSPAYFAVGRWWPLLLAVFVFKFLTPPNPHIP